MKEYLICIDSDGCAIDSMEIKHRRCFGPCIIDIWHLEPWRNNILKRWNEINLYSMTRGINRFLGLDKMLTEIHSTYKNIDGLEHYHQWCQTTSTFSNDDILREINSGNHSIFEFVLKWSEQVNRNIEKISSEIRPFSNVQESLEAMIQYADIAIVSSANPQAVADEWTRFGFMKYVDYVMAQDSGTKTECIRSMLAKGYKKEHILMLGDAPGDKLAAEDNHVLYYPILAGHENDSWKKLTTEALPLLFSGEYSKGYQDLLVTHFYNNLGQECPNTNI